MADEKQETLDERIARLKQEALTVYSHENGMNAGPQIAKQIDQAFARTRTTHKKSQEQSDAVVAEVFLGLIEADLETVKKLPIGEQFVSAFRVWAQIQSAIHARADAIEKKNAVDKLTESKDESAKEKIEPAKADAASAEEQAKLAEGRANEEYTKAIEGLNNIPQREAFDRGLQLAIDDFSSRSVPDQSLLAQSGFVQEIKTAFSTDSLSYFARVDTGFEGEIAKAGQESQPEAEKGGMGTLGNVLTAAGTLAAGAATVKAAFSKKRDEQGQPAKRGFGGWVFKGAVVSLCAVVTGLGVKALIQHENPISMTLEDGKKVWGAFTGMVQSRRGGGASPGGAQIL